MNANPNSIKTMKYKKKLLSNGWSRIDMLIPTDIKMLLMQYKRQQLNKWRDEQQDIES
jgi:hypothetical protein